MVGRLHEAEADGNGPPTAFFPLGLCVSALVLFKCTAKASRVDACIEQFLGSSIRLAFVAGVLSFRIYLPSCDVSRNGRTDVDKADAPDSMNSMLRCAQFWMNVIASKTAGFTPSRLYCSI